MNSLAFDFEPRDGASPTLAVVVIRGEGVDSYRHDDGDLESSIPLSSTEVNRPAVHPGGIVMRLAGARGTIDLVLSALDAEKIGLALIRGATLPVDDPTRPSNN
jgi:hypothetical protein